MIYDASRLPLPLRLSADLVVIGSGAGGMPVATICAEAGLSVVVLEAGGFVPPDAMNQREERMLPELLLDSGGQVTVDKAVRIHQGRSVGGSTVHNLNLCKRIPDQVLREWQRTRGLEHLPLQRWAALYDEVEQIIQVSAVPRARWNRHNRILQAGCDALGWRGAGLSHNRTGCIGSGFCELGCAYDAKNNACKVFLPRLVAAAGQVLSRVRATRVITQRGRAVGVEAVALHPVDGHPLGSVSVTAPRVCVSASATGTPALLLRSGLPDPGGETGQHLRVHPALIAAGIFKDPVRAWQGIPQTYECTELLDFGAAAGGADKPGSRIWIVPAFAHPMGTATMLPGYGKAHRESMQRYDHMAVLTGMLHDRTAGRVSTRGELGHAIRYWPDPADRAELVRGLVACTRLLFAAGAQQVVIPTDPVMKLAPGDPLDGLSALELRRGLLDITAVHPMASVPMGDDPAIAAVNSLGAHHHVRGLWVSDGSLFPTSIGVPPQLSIYSLAHHVGRAIAAS